MRARAHKLFATGGLAWALLRHDRRRVVLAICGIAVAVLAMTLLAGTGVGVLATGEAQFEAAEADLWMTGEPAAFTTAGGGGIGNAITDSQAVAADVRAHEDVAGAGPLGFQTVYVGDPDAELTTFIATGIPNPDFIEIVEGPGFSGDDRHYADGTFDGPMAHEVVLDNRSAERLDVEVGDTVHVGGSMRHAREHEFTVVGISPSIEQFLGAPTVIVHLSELQQITGQTHRDPAAMLVILVDGDADPEAVAADLDAAYPEYDVRTNREQLEAILGLHAILIAAGISLVGLAALAGLALSASLIALVVYQQRAELAALKALGVRTRSLVGVVVAQGAILGALGGLVGVGLTPPLAHALNEVGAAVVGLEGLVHVQAEILLAALLVAVAMGVLASSLAAWRVDRLPAVGGRDRR